MKMLVIGFGSFLFICLLVFIILISTSPEKPKPASIDELAAKGAKGEAAKTAARNSKYVKNLEKKYVQLKEELEQVQNQLSQKDVLIDSLNKVLQNNENSLTNKDNQITKLNDQITQMQDEEKNAKDLAKTFATMKTDEMKPILSNVNDKIVKRIYQNINTRMRKNFLLALGPKRAAELTKDLATAN